MGFRQAVSLQCSALLVIMALPGSTCLSLKDRLELAPADACTPSHNSPWTLPESSLAKRQAVKGTTGNWEGIAAKLHANLPVNVFITGGSVSTGPWAKQFLKTWVAEALPSGSTVTNTAKVGCGTECQLKAFDTAPNGSPVPDLVLIENAVNPYHNFGKPWQSLSEPRNIEGETRTLKQFLDRVGNSTTAPAVMLVGWLTMGDYFEHNTHPPHKTNQDLDMPVVEAAGKSYCSIRDVLFPHLEGRYFKNLYHATEEPKVQAHNLTHDGLHPVDETAGFMADIVSSCICDGIALHGR